MEMCNEKIICNAPSAIRLALISFERPVRNSRLRPNSRTRQKTERAAYGAAAFDERSSDPVADPRL